MDLFPLGLVAVAVPGSVRAVVAVSPVGAIRPAPRANAEDGQMRGIDGEVPLEGQSLDQIVGEALERRDDLAAAVADDMDVPVVRGAVRGSPVIEVGVGHDAQVLEKLQGAVDGSQVDVGSGSGDLLGRAVAQRAHRGQHLGALLRPAQAPLAQEPGQVAAGTRGTFLHAADPRYIDPSAHRGKRTAQWRTQPHNRVAVMATVVLGVLAGAHQAPQLADPDAPIVRADDLGLGRGDGCFETCRILLGPDGGARVERLPEHLTRFAASARLMELPEPDPERWTSLAQLMCEAWSPPPAREGSLKLMLTRGAERAGASAVPTSLALLSPIGAAPLRQRAAGVRVATLASGRSSTAFADAPWLLGGVKALSYAANMAAMREAGRRGADDAILVSTDGFVLEAPTATVVWASGGVVATTPAEGAGILLGTTQQALFDAAARAALPTRVTPARISDLLTADGLWLASSVRGIVEVTHVDGEPVKTDSVLTTRLRQLAGFESIDT